MRDQIQAPFDSRGESSGEKESKPKELSRPTIAEGLAKPKVAGSFYMRCMTCHAPGCNAPHYSGGDIWEYYDADMNKLPYGSGPRNGPRFLPGGPDERPNTGPF